MTQTVLGFDFGEKRIGIATGQTITGTQPRSLRLTQVNQKPDWHGIEKLINEWQPDILMVGIPKYLDGSDSEMSKRAERFSRQLEGRFNLPVDTVNEALSSFEAEQQLQKNKKIDQHNKQEIDKMAAAIIVQSWLEQKIHDSRSKTRSTTRKTCHRFRKSFGTSWHRRPVDGGHTYRWRMAS